MPAWWDSLETVNSITWWLRWVGAGLTFTGAICVMATLVTTKRAETLKTERDADRHLSDRQRQRIRDTLSRKPSGQLKVLCPLSNPEARNFALELVDVLNTAGWEAALDDRAFVNAPVGIKLWAHTDQPGKDSIAANETDEAAPERAQPILEALRDLGIELRFKHSVAKGELILVVGFKR
jgi:hypothetical protein